MDQSNFEIENQNPDRIFGFSRLPVDAQAQVRTLVKPRKLRTTKEINKLKRFLEATPYFKDLHVDDQTLTGIVTTATFKQTRKGKYVLRQEERGEEMYIVLYGECKAIIQNKEFLN